VLERGLVPAKQVLSQLSYTPIREAALILKHFPPFRNPDLRIFLIIVPNCTKPPSAGTSRAAPTDISLAKRLSFLCASRFISNFVCGYFEYFLKT
jgi:hypothetical protein